jgi:hypothetical protein
LEHYGHNEYQETIHLRAATALSLLGERGLARGAMGELVVDLLPGVAQRAFIADPIEPRWRAVLANDTSTSPLFGDAVSQDNIGAPAGMGQAGMARFGDAAVRGFAAWRARRGESPVPSIREYLRETLGPEVAALPAYAPPASYDARRGIAAAEKICRDPVFADFEVYRYAANLAAFGRLYTNMRRVAARAGREFDVHGNMTGSLVGFDAYPFSLAPFVDTIWFETSGLSQYDVLQHGWWNAWGTLRLELGVALAGNRPLMLLAGTPKLTPDLLTHDLAEISAGGGIPLAHPDTIGEQFAPALKGYADMLALRDQHRAVYSSSSRTRLADVALLYSVPTVMFDMCLPDASSTDTPALNDLAGAARALEEAHIPYDAVVLPHPELSPESLREVELSRYRVLIAPSLHQLSDRDIARLTRYLRGGGALAVLGKLGVRDERNQTRKDDTLAALRAAGRVVILGGGESFPASRISDTARPRALGARIAKELAPLLPEPIVAGDLPPMTWVKTWRHPGGFVSAHFVSYSLDFASGAATPLAPALVRLRLPSGVRADSARWFGPGELERDLPVAVKGRYAEVTLPAMRVYGVLVLGPKGAESRASAWARGDQRIARARRAGAGANGLEARIERVTALRARDPAAFDAAAGELLANLSAEREREYLAGIQRVAEFGDPDAAFAFGQPADVPPWRAVKVDSKYSRTLGFGWLPLDDDSRASPEEGDYVLVSQSSPDSLRALSLIPGAWPFPARALPAPVSAGIVSGKSRVFRVDLPNGDYRLSVIAGNGAWDQRSLAISGMVTANGRPVLLDLPLELGSLARRSFTVRVDQGALQLRFGGASGFGVTALLVDRVTGLEPDPLEAGAVRVWRVSPRHPNPDWAALEDVALPQAGDEMEVRASESGIPLVDLGTLGDASIGDVAVARADITRTAPGDAVLHFGASSAARVYLDGRLVLDVPSVVGVERDEGVARVRLRAGANRLEVVLERFWERRWLFYASVTDAPRAE